VRLARRDLGITAFGCQVFELPPNVGGPRHSESGTGQQELYVNLGGSGWIDVDGDRVEFGPRTMIHVTPESVRQPASGAHGRFVAERAVPAWLLLRCPGRPRAVRSGLIVRNEVATRLRVARAGGLPGEGPIASTERPCVGTIAGCAGSP
jgi:hypothetical protein